jgi:hypothetical protein
VAFAAFISPVVFFPQEWLTRQVAICITGRKTASGQWLISAEFIAVALLSAVLVAIALGLDAALRKAGGRDADDLPHCRRCDHILRGLSEPRCPECGEPI